MIAIPISYSDSVTETCIGHFQTDSPTCYVRCLKRDECRKRSGIPLEHKELRWKWGEDGSIFVLHVKISLEPLPKPEVTQSCLDGIS